MNSKIMDEKIQDLKIKARENYVPILQDVSMEVIETILEIKKPSSILEIGTAVGYSAICFSRHLGIDGVIDTVELNEDTANIARKNIEEFGLQDKITVHNLDGEAFMREQVLNNKKYDFIFIDAAKGQYVKYLDQALKLSNVGTVILADNVLFKGRVLGEYNEHKHRTAVNRLREYLEIVKSNEKLQTTILDVGDGLAISVVKDI